MKTLSGVWRNRSNYEKVILGLFSAFVLYCLGCYSAGLYYGSKCDICRQTLRNGEHYILDVRTGEILGLSQYIDQESSVFCFSPVSKAPQEVSVTNRLGYMRFPRQTTKTARYCANHTANLDSDFLLLSPTKEAAVCYAVPDGQTVDPDGRIITKRLNGELDCWELEIQWESKSPVLAP